MKTIPANRPEMPPPNLERLFNSAIVYMQGGEYAFAYRCLDRMGQSDLYLSYNKALCCYRVSWFSECRRLLMEAERQLPSLTDTRMDDLPKDFLRWEHEDSPDLCPMPYGTPPSIAAIQILKLKAYNSYRLHLYGEMKDAASRLGGKYKSINELIKETYHGNM